MATRHRTGKEALNEEKYAEQKQERAWEISNRIRI